MPADRCRGAFDRDGIRELSRTDRTVTVEIREDLRSVLSSAVQFGVQDLETHQVSLEEVFMAYYDQGEGGAW